MNSLIYTGVVEHTRLQPVRHQFGYSLYFYGLDLDELADFANRTQLADVPAPALTYLRAIIADTLAASAAGNQEAEMKARLAKQLPQVAAGHASVICTDLSDADPHYHCAGLGQHCQGR